MAYFKPQLFGHTVFDSIVCARDINRAGRVLLLPTPLCLLIKDVVVVVAVVVVVVSELDVGRVLHIQIGDIFDSAAGAASKASNLAVPKCAKDSTRLNGKAKLL